MIFMLLLAQATPAASVPQAPVGPGALGRGSETRTGSPLEDGALLLPRTSTDVTSPSIIDPNGGAAAGTGGNDRRGDTVTSRRRPDFDPLGIRAGSFLIFPEAAATVGFDSNVYRQPSGASDVFGRLRGSVAARSDFSRHAISVDGLVAQRLYSRYTTENALTYDLHLFGRLDVDRRDRVTVDVQRTHSVVERGATGEVLQTREPVRFDITSAAIEGNRAFGRVTVSVGGQVSHAEYADAETPAGLPLDQQYRNVKVYQAHTDIAYNTPAGAAFFVTVTGQARRFDNVAPPIIRDADSIEVVGGIRSDITPLLRGQIGVGYLYADFKDPTITARGAIALNIGLDYLLTELTTLHASARRALQNVASATAPAALVTELSVGADHELLRNVILSASTGYQNADYINQDGNVGRFTIDGGAQWLLNRRMRIDVDLGYRTRAGSEQSVSRDFSEALGSIGFVYRL